MRRLWIRIVYFIVVVVGPACKSKEREQAATNLMEKLALYDTLSQALLERNQLMGVVVDSLIIGAINDHFSAAQQNKILQDAEKMDDYRRWVEESEEALSKHGAATAAMVQEVAAAKSRAEPFIARNAPAREWIPEIDAQLELLKRHVQMAREAESRFQQWKKEYLNWLEKLKLAYPPDTSAATP